MSARNAHTRKLEPMSNAFLLKLGWWLFIVSAVLFGWSAIRSRDWIAAAGAGSFLTANISFMIPVYRDDHSSPTGDDQHAASLPR